ncbi:MAG TPA: phosphate ABC transporter substrate-binding protein PstS, partial [Anaerolineae bacterium]|nr:phosphate ABC transporter substrate-binding protein PstS [Anaerolineae bacterium]
GNEGVAAYVQSVNGAIGYVEFAYTLQNNLTHILLKNRAGNFVEPTIETFQSAASHADWENTPDFYIVLNDQPGEKSWPITGASFILIYKNQRDANLAKDMLSFFDWCYNHGTDVAIKLHYVPMPENVVELIHNQWKHEVLANGKTIRE